MMPGVAPGSTRSCKAEQRKLPTPYFPTRLSLRAKGPELLVDLEVRFEGDQCGLAQ